MKPEDFSDEEEANTVQLPPSDDSNTKVWMDIQIGSVAPQRVTFELSPSRYPKHAKTSGVCALESSMTHKASCTTKATFSTESSRAS